MTNLQHMVDKIRSAEELSQAEQAVIDGVNLLLDNPQTLFVSEMAESIVSAHHDGVLNSLLAVSTDEIASIHTAFSMVASDPPFFENDPSLSEAMASKEWPRWKAAITEEANSLKEMEVYVPVLRTNMPQGKWVLDGKLAPH
ncbi:hypothetical protein BDN71DRAFT_1505435 [Pleurotus eryngii]|uniref:Uncharacterized protein n=1 Tax=Pleurotus eryngii TaxID=5323 RepID=A0A9P6DHQ9_PLEER|nr:hypothetical protein BDN71DRAFT_1505435 [Pleurotus eryngii]